MSDAAGCHPRFADRRRDVGFEQMMAEMREWNQRGHPITAAERLEQARLREPIRRAAALGQLTEREFHKLHGYISALHGFEMGGRLVPMEPAAMLLTFEEVARVAA